MRTGQVFHMKAYTIKLVMKDFRWKYFVSLISKNKTEIKFYS